MATIRIQNVYFSAIVVNPPERKLAKRIFVQWVQIDWAIMFDLIYSKLPIISSDPIICTVAKIIFLVYYVKKKWASTFIRWLPKIRN